MRLTSNFFAVSAELMRVSQAFVPSREENQLKYLRTVVTWTEGWRRSSEPIFVWEDGFLWALKGNWVRLGWDEGIFVF